MVIKSNLHRLTSRLIFILTFFVCLSGNANVLSKGCQTAIDSFPIGEYLQVSSRGRLFSHRKFNSTIYHLVPETKMPKFPEIDINSRAIVIGLHGGGGQRSSGLNYINLANSLANYTSEEGKKVAFLSMDLPFHGSGPTNPLFNDINYLSRWLKKIIVHYQQSGLPVYLVGHSLGSSLIHEYIRKYPRSGVKGVFSIAQTGPLNRSMSEINNQMMNGGLEQFMAANNQLKNEAGYEWVLRMWRQIDPIESKQQFDGRVFIISGDSDITNTPEALVELGSVYKDVELSIIKGAGHLDILKHTADGDSEKLVVKTMLEEIFGQEINKLTKGSTLSPAQQLFLLTSSDLFNSWLVSTYPKLMRFLNNSQKPNTQKNKIALKVLTQWKAWLLIFALKARSLASDQLAGEPKLLDKVKRILSKKTSKISINDIQTLLKFIKNSSNNV